MPDDPRLTRRTLLKRAGIGAGLLLGAGFAYERITRDGAGSEYLPGFNDDFLTYSTSPFAGATMRKVRQCRGEAMRFGVDWSAVQAKGPDQFDWSAYQPLHELALRHDLQLLPTIFGCPEWAGPVRTAPRWPGNDPEFPADSYRTCSLDHDGEFGAFADATLRHFDSFARYAGHPTVIQAVEIFNEPNVWTFGAVPAARVRELATAAGEAVSESQASGAYSTPMRVVSGGLAPVVALEPGNRLGLPPRNSWQEYLHELTADDPGPFDIGIHSYESAKPPAGILETPEDNPDDPSARASEFAAWQAARIIEQLDEALEIAPGDLWLTETGASSANIWSTDIFSPAYRAEHGQSIQAEVLARVADQLKSRPRYRSMVVHRLFSDDRAEPPPTAIGDSPHYQDGVYESIDGRPKQAVGALAGAWG